MSRTDKTDPIWVKINRLGRPQVEEFHFGCGEQHPCDLPNFPEPYLNEFTRCRWLPGSASAWVKAFGNKRPCSLPCNYCFPPSKTRTYLKREAQREIEDGLRTYWDDWHEEKGHLYDGDRGEWITDPSLWDLLTLSSDPDRFSTAFFTSDRNRNWYPVSEFWFSTPAREAEDIESWTSRSEAWDLFGTEIHRRYMEQVINSYY